MSNTAPDDGRAERRGPDVDELAEAFPMVERGTLEKIRNSVQNLTFRTAADVLSNAAELGKVPDEDYTHLAAAAAPDHQLDLDTTDPLDEPPDGDPQSPHNMERGQRAIGHISGAEYPAKAERVAREGSISDMVDLLTTIDKWGNEALLDPNRTSLPNGVKKASQILGDAIVGRVDALAAQGNESALQDVRNELRTMRNQAFADALDRQIEQKIRLLHNDGTDYAAVRDRVLAETNDPDEVQRLQQEAIENADITYEQAQELIRDATEWLDEYHRLESQQ